MAGPIAAAARGQTGPFSRTRTGRLAERTHWTVLQRTRLRRVQCRLGSTSFVQNDAQIYGGWSGGAERLAPRLVQIQCVGVHHRDVGR
eukprot:scaffold86615_cov64-Phaeocystis_antarctica.AAC.1